MVEKLNITIYQQDIRWHEPEENRRRAEAALAKAPASDIFVVPETFTTGFGDGMADLAEEPDGPTLQWARRMAAEHDLMVVGSWIVREGGRCYNRMHWVHPDGNYGAYDKAHTFRPSGEHEVIACGTQKEVFEWRGWRIKPAVCYDLRFPKWLRNDNMGYDLLLVCANWPGSRHEAAQGPRHREPLLHRRLQPLWRGRRGRRIQRQQRRDRLQRLRHGRVQRRRDDDHSPRQREACNIPPAMAPIP